MAKKYSELIDLTKNNESTTTTSKGKKKSQPFVTWCATAFLHKFDDDEALAKYLAELQELCKYFLAGREVCPKTKKIHFQMYFVLEKRMRLEELKRLEPTVHYEPAKGNFDQNFAYCTKEDPDFLEVGERPIDAGEREKNRWATARSSAIKGDFDVVDDQIFISYYKALQQIHRDSVVVPDEIDHCCGIFLYGVPHSGKSYMARHSFGNSLFLKLPKIEWWDGYNFEEVVLIEDVTPALFNPTAIQAIKCWTDIYPFPVEVKGGNIKAIRPKLIVFTSNYSFEECFGGENTDSYKAMIRRFKVFYFPKVFRHEEDDGPYYLEHKPVVANPGTVPTFHIPPALCPSSAPVLAIDTSGGKLTLTRSDTICLPPGSQALSSVAERFQKKYENWKNKEEDEKDEEEEVIPITPSPSSRKKKRSVSPGAPSRVRKVSRPVTPRPYLPGLKLTRAESQDQDEDTQEE